MTPSFDHLFWLALEQNRLGVVSFARRDYVAAAREFSEGLALIKPELILSIDHVSHGDQLGFGRFFYPFETKVSEGVANSPVHLNFQHIPGVYLPLKHLVFLLLYNIGLAHLALSTVTGLHPYARLGLERDAFSFFDRAEALAVVVQLRLDATIELSLIYNKAQICQDLGDWERLDRTMKRLLGRVLAADESTVQSEDLDFFYSKSIIHFTGVECLSSPAA